MTARSLSQKKEAKEFFLEFLSGQSSFNQIITINTTRIETLLIEFFKVTEKLNQQLIQAATTVTDSSALSRQLTAAVEEIAKGMESQLKSVMEVSRTVSDTSEIFKSVVEKSRETSLLSSQTTQAARHGAELISLSGRAIQEVKAISDKSVFQVVELQESSERISEIVELIDDVAEQTNLLALNAAIEAARAGEHGRGFAVVAEEIGKLASKSRSATKEIRHILTGVQKGTKDVAATIDISKKEAEKGLNLSIESVAEIQTIVAAVENTDKNAQTVFDFCQEIEKKFANLISATTTMSSISEEYTATGEEVAASAQEINSAFKKLTQFTEAINADMEDFTNQRVLLHSTLTKILGETKQAIKGFEELYHTFQKTVEALEES
ncbi:MAG: methyl-accepting chemotaxis protein [Firmicutes bacterium]|nr:methyl-accepting chemotaxis protein [Bacillota bacterium]